MIKNLIKSLYKSPPPKAKKISLESELEELFYQKSFDQIIPFLIKNKNYRDNRENIVYLFLKTCSNLQSLKEGLELFWSWYPDKNLNYDQSKYSALQYLFIKNPNFHIRELYKIYPFLKENIDWEFFKKSLVPLKGYCPKEWFDYYLLMDLTSLTKKEILSFCKDQGLSYPKFLEEVFHNTSAINYPSLDLINDVGLQHCSSFQDFYSSLFSKNSVKIKRILIELISKNDYDTVMKIRLLSSLTDNIDLQSQLIEAYIEDGDDFLVGLSSDPRGFNQYKNILDFSFKKTSFNQFIKYFISDLESSQYALDTMRMFMNISSEAPDLSLRKIKDFSSLKGFHDYLSKELVKIKNKPFDLNQEIDHINEKTIPQMNLKIYVPKTNIDLILTGSELGICIGSSYFAKGVRDKEYYMLFLRTGEEVKIVVHLFRDFKIKEIKKKNNEKLSKQEESVIQDFLFKHRSS